MTNMLHGFGLALPDFFFFLFSLYLVDGFWRPAVPYKWFFFVIFIFTAILFFLAWIGDLGAKIAMLHTGAGM